MKKKVVILSGAGISAESGLRTFRDSADGLWNEYNIEDVCTAAAWDNNPTLVNDFYNMRRIDAMNAQPNKAHTALAAAEEIFDIQVITTNVDDLHERAGSTKVLHLHGSLLKARSSNPDLDWTGLSVDPAINTFKTYPVGREGISKNDMAEDGFPLRPDIVFFDEAVPLIVDAEKLVQECDALVVVGTSLSVYPAAGLVWQANAAPVFYIEPSTDPDAGLSFPCRFYNTRATIGVPQVLNELKTIFNLH